MSAQVVVSQAVAAAVPRAARTSVGIVVSAGLMTKTVKVRIAGEEWNEHLRKNFKANTNFLVHDEASACREGDVVKITRIPKQSKWKKYFVSEVITPFGVGERTPIETEEQREQRMLERRCAKLERRVMAKPWLLRAHGIKVPPEGVREKAEGVEEKVKVEAEERLPSIREQLFELLKEKKLK